MINSISHMHFCLRFLPCFPKHTGISALAHGDKIKFYFYKHKNEEMSFAAKNSN